MKTYEELFDKYTYAQYASPKTDKIIFSKKDEPIYITTKEAISDLLTEHDAEIVKIIDEMEMGRRLKESKLEDCLIETLGAKLFDKDYYMLGWERALTELKKILVTNEKK